MIRLIPGKRYNVDDLADRMLRVSWTRGDGSGSEGYHWSSYFSEDGTYLGPDQHGIEPEFWVRGSDQLVGEGGDE